MNPTGATPNTRWPMPDFTDPEQANSARVADWLMNGSINTPVDRVFGGKVAGLLPAREILSRNNEFIGRVRAQAAAAGVRQTLHLGCGMPTVSDGYPILYPDRGIREVAVDYDPVVIQARKTGPRRGIGLTPSILEADIRDPDTVLTSAPVRDELNLARPMVLLATAVAHHIPDSQDPGGILARYAAALAPGSYIALSHLTLPDDDDDADRLADVVDLYRTNCQPLYPRPREVLTSWLHGLDPVPTRPAGPFLHVAVARTPRRARS